MKGYARRGNAVRVRVLLDCAAFPVSLPTSI